MELEYFERGMIESCGYKYSWRHWLGSNVGKTARMRSAFSSRISSFPLMAFSIELQRISDSKLDKCTNLKQCSSGTVPLANVPKDNKTFSTVPDLASVTSSQLFLNTQSSALLWRAQLSLTARVHTVNCFRYFQLCPNGSNFLCRTHFLPFQLWPPPGV